MIAFFCGALWASEKSASFVQICPSSLGKKSRHVLLRAGRAPSTSRLWAAEASPRGICGGLCASSGHPVPEVVSWWKGTPRGNYNIGGPRNQTNPRTQLRIVSPPCSGRRKAQTLCNHPLCSGLAFMKGRVRQPDLEHDMRE